MRTLSLVMICASMILAALGAIHAKSLIRAALWLALGSSSLALLLFLQHAFYAGAVQLSVGAGVLSTLFLLAISLTESMRGRTDED